MSYKLLIISSIYQGYLNYFYKKNGSATSMKYSDLLEALIADSSEFVGSYVRNFRKIGIEASAIVTNDKNLQEKWLNEHGLKAERIKDIIFEQVRAFQPEILLIENLSIVGESWMENIRKKVESIKIVAGYHCAPLNSKVLNSLRGIDLIITCTPGLRLLFESYGKKSFLVYHGFDPDILAGLNNDLDYTNDLVFSGSLTTGGNFHNERIKLIEDVIKNDIDLDLYVSIENNLKIKAKQFIWLINSGLRKTGMRNVIQKVRFLEHGKSKISNYSDALLRKRKPPVFGADMYDLLRHSRVVLNYHIGVAGNYAGNMRMFEVTGVGSCLLTDNKKNMSELFDTGCEVMVYDNAKDCISRAKWLLENEDERKKIALAGQQKTLRFHTVENRCRAILDIFNSEQKGK